MLPEEIQGRVQAVYGKIGEIQAMDKSRETPANRQKKQEQLITEMMGHALALGSNLLVDINRIANALELLANKS